MSLNLPLVLDYAQSGKIDSDTLVEILSKGKDEDPLICNPTIFKMFLSKIEEGIKENPELLLKLANIEDSDGTPLFFNMQILQMMTPSLCAAARRSPEIVKQALLKEIDIDDGTKETLFVTNQESMGLDFLITARGNIFQFLVELSKANGTLFKEIAEALPNDYQVKCKLEALYEHLVKALSKPGSQPLTPKILHGHKAS